ncbi:hypothetical protein [Azospirillum rugosum]|uniref:Nucleotide modification associated domain-containing protein n=1 Tax=Azospirillum rugosum TaxID=416170 RepID=A0ABS4SJJ9_9PROT|nr:hypothetical protein [Azospirillum rugosum]MBP2292670.1 hypothetical protein [Azospirillum rugosum]MDQ0526306.1 hypothetical protein [Azospirillum rugosum]
MNDPIFVKTPTLGACVPNIRRAVSIGDWIFAISGRIPGERQFVVGGFRVNEKIDQLAAFHRFPENRLHRGPTGQMMGNVIVNADGTQHPEDTHSNFERRLENYIVGGQPIVLETPDEIDRGRAQTLTVLSQIFGRQGNRVFDIIGRGRKMDTHQVNELHGWLESLKQ